MPKAQRPIRFQTPWVSQSTEAATAVAVRLLIGGQSLEVPAFVDEPGAAALFTARLLAWVGCPVSALGSMREELMVCEVASARSSARNQDALDYRRRNKKPR